MIEGINLVTGDTHGELQDMIKFHPDNFHLGKTLTKADVLFILGDFGWLNPWGQDMLDWFNICPWTTCFIDGNHDNFDVLDGLDTDSRYGSDVGVVRDSVLHLRRGRIYTINGDRIFTFGGGLSIDKASRQYWDEKKGSKSWWAREYPSEEEVNLAWKNIAQQKSVDYVLSHTPPWHIIDYYRGMSHHGSSDYDITSVHLRDFSQQLTFKLWYHGHMHVDDQQHDKYIGLYNRIFRLGEEFPHYAKLRSSEEGLY